MAETGPAIDIDSVMTLVAEATSEKKITLAAAGNLKEWLTESKYSSYVPGIIEHIEAGKWQQLDDVFWTCLLYTSPSPRD